MTSVKIVKKDGRITEVVCDGHTDFGEEGEDIVCAALSSIVQTAVLGLMQVAGINLSLKRDDEAGFLSLKLPERLSEKQRSDADIILATMLLGVSDLHEGFSKYIKLEVR